MATKKNETVNEEIKVDEEAVMNAPAVSENAEGQNVPATVEEPKQNLAQKAWGAIKSVPKKIGEGIEKHPKIAVAVGVGLGIAGGVAYEKYKAGKDAVDVDTTAEDSYIDTDAYDVEGSFEQLDEAALDEVFNDNDVLADDAQ